MFAGQAGLQVFLLLISFVAVPWMLLPKPLILKKRHEQRTQQVRAAPQALFSDRWQGSRGLYSRQADRQAGRQGPTSATVCGSGV